MTLTNINFFLIVVFFYQFGYSMSMYSGIKLKLAINNENDDYILKQVSEFRNKNLEKSVEEFEKLLENQYLNSKFN